MSKINRLNFILKICIMWCLFFFIIIIAACIYKEESFNLLVGDIKTFFFEDNFFPKAFKIKIILASIIGIFTCSISIFIIEHLRPLSDFFKGKHGNIILLSEGLLFVVITILYLSPKWMQISTNKNSWPGDTCIMHALGGIDGFDYTNSLEAFEYNYSHGVKTFEIDFSRTSDNQLVCWHSWSETQINSQYPLETIPTRNEFLNTKILNHYTPLSPEDLFILMKEHDDIWIITDTKDTDWNIVQDDFRLLLEAAQKTDSMEVLNRLIVQLYTYEMYDAIEEIYSFPMYILTLYKIGGIDTHSFTKHCRFCASHGINNLTMWVNWVTPELVEIARRYHINIYIHTVNNLSQVQNMKSMGVVGFYTDFLLPEKLNFG